MVYSLVCLAVRRNLRFSTKSFPQVLLPKRFPYLEFSTDCNKDKEKENKSGASKNAVPKRTYPDGQSHVYGIIEQAKTGKISFDDIKSLTERVIREGNYQNFKQAPVTVQRIGFSGLIPMFGIPLMTIVTGHASTCCVFAQLACGATILSFLGGSNWNEAISQNNYSYEKLLWCITPQLIGWTSLLLPIPLGILWTSVGFSLSLVHDVLLSKYPQWMKSMRLVLTGGILSSFVFMLLLYIIL